MIACWLNAVLCSWVSHEFSEPMKRIDVNFQIRTSRENITQLSLPDDARKETSYNRFQIQSHVSVSHDSIHFQRSDIKERVTSLALAWASSSVIVVTCKFDNHVNIALRAVYFGLIEAFPLFGTTHHSPLTTKVVPHHLLVICLSIKSNFHLVTAQQRPAS